ncbi:hypothetical protein [Ferrimonas sp. YFM]|uniref:hypothetical protein n=1 Tax=Ferrimonas sp. YFM TaxID=3028878 RepID=UPI002573A5EF|nr:hypothetical protein [Ferrimonas sp. YFM]BDY06987.1 hypothetical protein F0521_40280 [Ferrimonas sp. YFM]
MEISKIALCTALALTLTACGGGGGGGTAKTNSGTSHPLQVKVINEAGEVMVDPTTRFVFHSLDGAVVGTYDAKDGVGPKELPENTAHLSIVQSRGPQTDPIPVIHSFLNWNSQGIDTLTLSREDIAGDRNCKEIKVDTTELRAQLGNYSLTVDDFEDVNDTLSFQTCQHQGKWQPLSLVAMPKTNGPKPYGALYPITDATPSTLSIPADLMSSEENEATELEVSWSSEAFAGESYINGADGFDDLTVANPAGGTSYYFPNLGSKPYYRGSQAQRLGPVIFYTRSVSVPIKEHRATLAMEDTSVQFNEVAFKLIGAVADEQALAHYDLREAGSASVMLVQTKAKDYATLWSISGPTSGTLPLLKLPEDVERQLEKQNKGRMISVMTMGIDKPLTLQAYRQMMFEEQAKAPDERSTDYSRLSFQSLTIMGT